MVFVMTLGYTATATATSTITASGGPNGRAAGSAYLNGQTAEVVCPLLALWDRISFPAAGSTPATGSRELLGAGEPWSKLGERASTSSAVHADGSSNPIVVIRGAEHV
jgi:hypothetical protein